MDKIVDAAVGAGLMAGEVRQIDGGGAFLALPAGAQIHGLEAFMPAPPYAKATVSAKTVASLIEYTNRHKTSDTAAFADADAGVIKVVIDYISAANDPAHKVHAASYAAPFSEEWKRWTSIDGKRTAQAEFAAFIEENREDIISPDGATVLELAKSLDAKRKVSFKSGVRLDNGDYDLEFKDETTASGGGVAGKIAIPSEIELGIPVFYGGDRYKIKALFRYRIEDGRLLMWVDLHRSKHVRDAAFADIIQAVRDGASGVPVFEASVQ
jgi:uncharacterized protein YfdQ (DUF2303 family)